MNTQTPQPTRQELETIKAYLLDFFSFLLDLCGTENLAAQYAQPGHDRKALDDRVAYIVKEGINAYSGGQLNAAPGDWDVKAIAAQVIEILHHPENKDALLLSYLDILSIDVDLTPLQRGH